MNEELWMFLGKNLFNAIILAAILSWVVSFLFNKKTYLEMKKRIRTVFSIVIFIVLFFVDIAPTELDVKNIMKDWYPKAENITVITIEKSKISKNGYDAYMTWSLNGYNCNGVILVTTEKKISNTWSYELPNESIKCK